MLRHHGSERVKAGFYLNLQSWEITPVSGRDGGILTGGATDRYLRLPVLAMLVFAPLMGALFAIFLPFIGLALVTQYVAVRAWHGAKRGSEAVVSALGPAWQPSAAHLAGAPEERKRRAAESKEQPNEKLDELEREITARADEEAAARK